MLVPRPPLPHYRRTSIRKSPDRTHWVVTHGTSRTTMTFHTGALAIAAVENAIKRVHAHRVLEDLRYQQVRATRMHRLRQRLANRDGPNCHYCGRHLHPEKRTIDHVIPKVLKGPSSLDNFVLACGRCNRKKGHTVHPNHCAFCANAAELYWSGEQYSSTLASTPCTD